MTDQASPLIVLVAGEASGDQLGAALMESVRDRCPGARFAGIGGPRMQAAGFDAWWDSEELAVMGLFEVLKHLPRLLRLRRELIERIVTAKPDLMVGIDSPDFNLGVEKRLRAQGVRTAHYVSPTVWAWRQGRARKIGQSADMVLCLFPFEPPFYSEHGVSARYTGHPMADAIPLQNDREAARQALHLPATGIHVALLPGSRLSEIERLADPLLDAAAILTKRHPGIQFTVPLPSARTADAFRMRLASRSMDNLRLMDGRALEAMAAADVVVCASGTASLECMLVNRPMVVVYRLAAGTFFAARHLGLVKSKFIALPNILAGKGLVPELIQNDATGEGIAAAVERWLDDPARRENVSDQFHALHNELRIGAAASAAGVIMEMLE